MIVIINLCIVHSHLSWGSPGATFHSDSDPAVSTASKFSRGMKQPPLRLVEYLLLKTLDKQKKNFLFERPDFLFFLSFLFFFKD